MEFVQLIVIASGLAWCFGQYKEWDEDATLAIGWVFWIALLSCI